MKKILVINHSTRPGVFDYKSGETPTVTDDIAEWFTTRRHGKVLQDLGPDKKEIKVAESRAVAKEAAEVDDGERAGKRTSYRKRNVRASAD